jgi:hypothetical protein
MTDDDGEVRERVVGVREKHELASPLAAAG